jgi:hypothetical protein
MADLVTVQVDLRPQDVYEVYDPFRNLFQYSWLNCFRWAFLLFETYLIYETHPPALFVLALFLIFILATLFLSPYLRVRSVFRESPTLRNTRTLSVGAEGIRVESEDGRGEYKWSVFPYVLETPRAFIFAQSSRGFGGTWIPKRCLSTPNDIVRLRDLVRSNCKGKIRLLRD